MKILITGGTGFIGSRLAAACLASGDAVRVLGQTNNPVEASNADEIRTRGGEILLGSVVDPETVAKAAAGAEIVFHLAAAQHEANVPDQHFWDVNVTGTQNLLEASARAGVRRFVHGSTIGVYGGRLGETVTDDSPSAPTNIYGITKRKAEEIVDASHGRLSTVTIRISETYGPGDRRLLKLFRGLRKGRFFLIGAGENLHHLIYVDDLVEGLRFAATTEDAAGETIVLAGGSPVSTRDLCAAIARELKVSPPRLHLPLRPLWLAAAAMETVLRPLSIAPPLHRRRMNFFLTSFSFTGDAARAKLGFTARTGLEQGLRQTAGWYRTAGLL